MNIEHGTFTALIFALNGGVGTECSIFHKHLAERIASKTKEKYDSVLIGSDAKFRLWSSGLACCASEEVVRSTTATTSPSLTTFNWFVTMLVYFNSLVLRGR